MGGGAGQLQDVLEIGAFHQQGLLQLGIIHRNDTHDGRNLFQRGNDQEGRNRFPQDIGDVGHRQDRQADFDFPVLLPLEDPRACLVAWTLLD